MNQLSKEEATKFFSHFFFGEHHFPGTIKPWGEGWIMGGVSQLATYDFNHLTRLVVLAHDMCMRAEIIGQNNNTVKIAIHKRDRDGGMSGRHPTLEDAIIHIRKTNEERNK